VVDLVVEEMVQAPAQLMDLLVQQIRAVVEVALDHNLVLGVWAVLADQV
jgi:hypothetical protein